MSKSFGTYIRPGPDLITEELAKVLLGSSSFEFKPLFDMVHSNLLVRKSSKGSEEMLRLRTYEKLQYLVQQGMVKKTITKAGKRYRGLTTLASLLPTAPAKI